MSGSFLLIPVMGRRSGKQYTTPVNYVRNGETLLILSQGDRTWWKNLRGGAKVEVRLQGREEGRGEVFEEPETVIPHLLTLLGRSPGMRRVLRLRLNTVGQPEDPAAFARFAADKVIVLISLLTAV